MSNHDVLIAFGSNQGDSETIFAQAYSELKTEGLSDAVTSQPLKTDPVGGPPDQPPYLNGAFRGTTSLSPQELHQRLIEVETRLGRVREQRWGARRIDLDLLICGDLVIQSDTLTVPHPRMSFRKFVLEPAVEVASEMVHPVSGLTIGQLWQYLHDSLPKILVVGFEIGGEHEDWTAGWDLLSVSTLQEFESNQEEARLIVFADKGCDSSLIRAARRFPGPTLQLPDDRETSIQEIKAAIQAMS